MFKRCKTKILAFKVINDFKGCITNIIDNDLKIKIKRSRSLSSSSSLKFEGLLSNKKVDPFSGFFVFFLLIFSFFSFSDWSRFPSFFFKTQSLLPLFLFYSKYSIDFFCIFFIFLYIFFQILFDVLKDNIL
jgi:hypothetical protein